MEKRISNFLKDLETEKVKVYRTMMVEKFGTSTHIVATAEYATIEKIERMLRKNNIKL